MREALTPPEATLKTAVVSAVSGIALRQAEQERRQKGQPYPSILVTTRDRPNTCTHRAVRSERSRKRHTEFQSGPRSNF
jgi:hypothetical protein